MKLREGEWKQPLDLGCLWCSPASILHVKHAHAHHPRPCVWTTDICHHLGATPTPATCVRHHSLSSQVASSLGLSCDGHSLDRGRWLWPPQSSGPPGVFACKPLLCFFSAFLPHTPSLQGPSEAGEPPTHHSSCVLPSPGGRFFRKLFLEIVTSE